MRWWNRKPVEKTASTAEPDESQESIPLVNTPHEELIDQILEEARDVAEGKQIDEHFTVTVELPRNISPEAIVGPVMVRSFEYGLFMRSCLNGTFEFYRTR